MTIDHLVYRALDLSAAVDHLEHLLGVRPVAGGQHVGRGTHNALADLGGGTYLEVIAPDPDQPPPALPRPFGLDSATEPGLAGWAVRVDDIDEAVARLRGVGYDPGNPADMGRVTADGTELRWRLTLNTAGGPLPFLISWGNTPHPSTRAPQGLTLESLAVASPDPAALEPILAALGVDVAVHERAEPGFTAMIGGPKGVVELS